MWTYSLMSIPAGKGERCCRNLDQTPGWQDPAETVTGQRRTAESSCSWLRNNKESQTQRDKDNDPPRTATACNDLQRFKSLPRDSPLLTVEAPDVDDPAVCAAAFCNNATAAMSVKADRLRLADMAPDCLWTLARWCFVCAATFQLSI